jgi:hypothetical protein
MDCSGNIDTLDDSRMVGVAALDDACPVLLYDEIQDRDTSSRSTNFDGKSSQ